MALWVQAGTCPPRHRSNLNFQETSWCRCRVSRGCRLISAYCDYLFKTLGDTLAQRGRGKGGGLTKKRIPVKLFRALCSCKTRAGVGDITIPLGRDASAALTERLCLVGWLTGAHHSSAELLMIDLAVFRFGPNGASFFLQRRLTARLLVERRGFDLRVR